MRKHNSDRYLIPTFLLVLLCATPVAAQYYHVTGRVTDSRGAGIWQVDLDIFDSQTGTPLNIANDLTDQNGDYDIVLFPGTFDIEYNAPPGTKLVSEAVRNIAVQGDVVVDVVFQDGYYLSGNVTDSQGIGVYRLDIDVDDATSGNRILTPRDKTDISGNYQVVVPSGTFNLTYEPPPGNRLVAIFIPNVQINGDTVVNVSCEDGFYVSGWVVDEGGLGIPDIDLDVEELKAGESVPTPRDNTDNAGHYLIVLPPGTFSITFDPLLQIDLAPSILDSVVISADTILDSVTLLNGVRLSGWVTDVQGGEVEGADLDIFDSATQRAVLTLHDNTDSSGYYATTVPPGLFDLVMNPPLGSDLGGGFFPSVAIGGDTTVNFVLSPTGIGGEPNGGGNRIPRTFRLSQNFPNPFNPHTTIHFQVPEHQPDPDIGATAERVLLEIFDIRGHRIRTLIDGNIPPGNHRVVWDGRDGRGESVVSGVYIYRLLYGDLSLQRKMVVRK